MRILVCGSRDFCDYQRIRSILAALVSEHSTALTGADDLTLIHGDARGADRMAAGIASELGFGSIEAYPAKWEEFGKRAGYLRNQQMLDEGKPDLVVAFRIAVGESKGTDMMLDLARKAGVRTVTYNPAPVTTEVTAG